MKMEALRKGKDSMKIARCIQANIHRVFASVPPSRQANYPVVVSRAFILILQADFDGLDYQDNT